MVHSRGDRLRPFADLHGQPCHRLYVLDTVRRIQAPARGCRRKRMAHGSQDPVGPLIPEPPSISSQRGQASYAFVEQPQTRASKRSIVTLDHQWPHLPTTIAELRNAVRGFVEPMPNRAEERLPSLVRRGTPLFDKLVSRNRVRYTASAEMLFEHVMNIGAEGAGEGQFNYVEDFDLTINGQHIMATDAAHAFVQVFARRPVNSSRASAARVTKTPTSKSRKAFR